jgi:hypothetical protein
MNPGQERICRANLRPGYYRSIRRRKTRKDSSTSEGFKRTPTTRRSHKRSSLSGWSSDHEHETNSKGVLRIPKVHQDLRERELSVKTTRRLTSSTWDVNVPEKATIWSKNCFAILLLLVV